mgnify:CR=1 FL=1
MFVDIHTSYKTYGGMLEYMEYEGRVLNKTVYVGNGVIMVIFCVFVFVMFVREVTMGASSSSFSNPILIPARKSCMKMSWDVNMPSNLNSYMSREVYTYVET